jgi:Mrp family chromosome partitioning ATPase
MSQMLDALRRIESKTTAARNEYGDSPSEVHQPSCLATDSGRQVDRCEANDCADGPIVQTLPFGPSSEVIQRDSDRRCVKPRSKRTDRAYSELAKTVMGQFAKNSEAAILFTSPGDGEGKTSTVMGLAGVLARADSGKVLAVDGNFRRPGLADWVDIEADRGLVEVLSGQAKWPEVIQTTGIDNLSILPSRADPSVDDYAVEYANLADLLSELRREFRFVLFDGASLRYPEVAKISWHFDGVYLVIELNRTSRSEARQAVRIVDDCDGRLLGCVLTNEVRGEEY